MTMSNAEFSTEPQFVAACQKANQAFGLDIKPTAAQASKYRRGFGAAYNAEHGQELGSRVMVRQRPEASEAQSSSAALGKINDYGPFSPTPRNQKPAPLPVKKRQ